MIRRIAYRINFEHIDELFIKLFSLLFHLSEILKQCLLPLEIFIVDIILYLLHRRLRSDFHILELIFNEIDLLFTLL
jgi:hypothetical protein